MNIQTHNSTLPVPLSMPASATIPKLQAGDRLTRAEFERRYHAMPELKKAELIEGVVYIASPVSSTNHGDLHFDLIGWLSLYRAHTPGIRGGDNATVRLDGDNEPQPDALLRITPAFGGQSINSAEGGYIEGAPELAAEIAASSASYDLHDKMHVYRRAGVQEYIVWRVWDRAIDWFVLREGKYEALLAGNDGLLRSEVFPGLWLDPVAMLSDDSQRVLQVALQGIAAPEHQQFVERLAAKQKP